MTSLMLTDCLRATPSRTLAALAVELSRRATRSVRPRDGLGERTLPRQDTGHGEHRFPLDARPQ